MHISYLELLAATLAQTFAKKQDSLLIHLKMDSTSALPYIYKMVETVPPELNRLTKGIWSWCLARSITIYASHLPGSLNEKVDEESRIMKDRSDWRLCPGAFQRVIILRKKGSKTKKRVKEEEIEKGDCNPPTP